MENKNVFKKAVAIHNSALKGIKYLSFLNLAFFAVSILSGGIADLTKPYKVNNNNKSRR